jgi:cell wall-associated NlpC family hydrolase
LGVKPSAEDRMLDPDAPPPPKRPPTVPDPLAETPPPDAPPPDAPASPPASPGSSPASPPPTTALTEPKEPPRLPPPPQPRNGDPRPELDPLTPSGLIELVERYAHHLGTVIAPWIGTPYLWGGTTLRVGTDCSGFTSSVFHDGFSIDLPRTSRDQFLYGRSVSKAELQPGDLVFFDTMNAGRVTHVGVYTGKGQFAHASSTKGVMYAKIEARPYGQMFRGARRVLAYPASAGR